MKIKKKQIKKVRAALVGAMKVIAKEHICNGCCTDSGNHEVACEYTQAVLLLNGLLYGTK